MVGRYVEIPYKNKVVRKHSLYQFTGNLTKNMQKPCTQRKPPTQKSDEIPALHASQTKQSTNSQRKVSEKFVWADFWIPKFKFCFKFVNRTTFFVTS